VNVAWLLLFDQAQSRPTWSKRSQRSPPPPLDTLLFGDSQLDLRA